MGWSGYGLYDGDGTQTLQIGFIEDAIPSLKKSDFIYEWMTSRGTKIPKEYLSTFKKGIPNIIKNIRSPKFWNEDAAFEWQMLLALLVFNKIKIPKIVLSKGIEASEFLMEEHSQDFDEPYKRRATLRNFIKRVKNLNKK